MSNTSNAGNKPSNLTMFKAIVAVMIVAFIILVSSGGGSSKKSTPTVTSSLTANSTCADWKNASQQDRKSYALTSAAGSSTVADVGTSKTSPSLVRRLD